MKQNAVGLSNICILSTAVLIIVSSTCSLIFGMDEIGQTRYPNDFSIYVNEESTEKSQEGLDKVHELQQQMGLDVVQETQYSYFSCSSVKTGDTFTVERIDPNIDMNDIANLIFVPLDDYNTFMGTETVLADDEVLIYSNRMAFDYPVLKVFDKEYQVKETLDMFMGMVRLHPMQQIAISLSCRIMSKCRNYMKSRKKHLPILQARFVIIMASIQIAMRKHNRHFMMQ